MPPIHSIDFGRILKTTRGVSLRIGSVHAFPRRRRGNSTFDSDGTTTSKTTTPSTTSVPPLVVFAHATGFCKEVWKPVVDALSLAIDQPFHWLALDFSGHGDSKPFSDHSWRRFCADDIFDAITTAESELGITTAAVRGRESPHGQMQPRMSSLLGVGHSMGGAALMLAESAKPGSFQRLALFEPIVWGTDHFREGKLEHPLSVLARRRRRHWPDVETAREYFQSRGAFSKFTEAAMECLIQGCVRPCTGTQAGVELKCDPESEALLYMGSVPWDDATFNVQRCESVSIAVGAKSPFPMTPEFYREFVHARITHSRGGYDTGVDGGGGGGGGDGGRCEWLSPSVAPECAHFLVMENPSWCADFVRNALWPGWTVSRSQTHETQTQTQTLTLTQQQRSKL